MTTTNTLFPGRPNYTGPTVGWFGLLHHDLLIEKSHDVLERVAYVRDRKPQREIATRLHNMIYIGEVGAAYDAAAKPARDAVLAYIKTHIPDCAWDGRELVFPNA